MPDQDASDIETLVYSWADQTLTGIGFGVVGLTEGWRWPTRPEGAALAGILVPTGFADNERTFAFIPDSPFGAALALRRELGQDRSGRRGRVVVEIHVGGDRDLTTAEALLIADQRLSDLDWPVDASPTRSLPRIDRPRLPSPTAISATALASLLDSVDGKQTVTATALTALASASTILPAAVCRSLAITSTTDRLAGRALLRVDLSGAVSSEPSTTSLALATRLIALGEMPPADLPTLADLAKWVGIRERERIPVAELDDRDLTELLLLGGASRPQIVAASEEWVARELRGSLSEQARGAMWNQTSAEGRGAVTSALATHAGESPRALAVATLWGVDRNALTRAAAHLITDASLVDRNPSAQESLAPYVQEYVARRPTAALSSDLRRRWIVRLLSSEWGVGTAAVTRAFWVEGDRPSPGLADAAGELLAAHGPRTADLVRTVEVGAQRIEAALRALPEGALAANLESIARLVRRESSPAIAGPWRIVSTPVDPAMSTPAAGDARHPRRRAGVVALCASTLAFALTILTVVLFAPVAGSGALATGIGAAATTGATVVLLTMVVTPSLFDRQSRAR